MVWAVRFILMGLLVAGVVFLFAVHVWPLNDCTAPICGPLQVMYQVV